MLSIDQVVSKFPEHVRSRYDFSKATYAGALVRMEHITCPEHGGFSQYSGALRKGIGCPACGAASRRASITLTQSEFLDAARAATIGKAYDFSRAAYTGMQNPVTVICPTHGEFQIRPTKLIHGRQGCTLCEAEAKRTRILKYRHLSAQAKIDNTAKTFFDDCRAAHKGRYTYPDQPYLGAKHKIRVVCDVHGEFEQQAWVHLNGQGCKLCWHKSSQELVIRDYLESLGVTVELRNRVIMAPKEIDLWLPDYNIGIEYHGLRWHTVDRIGDLHRAKWRIAQELGVRLIQIFEDEWFDKQSVVKARLAALVGKCPVIAARCTTVAEVPVQDANKFLTANHLQGRGTPGYALGLVHDNELVAVATFGPARTGSMTGARGQGWEVYRYASIGRVQGGFGKLFAQFLRVKNPDTVISYCDLRYGDGRLYKTLGFKLDAITDPNYWWVPNGKIKRIPRYQTQKHKLATMPEIADYYDAGKSEKQICEAAGWRKILDAGNQRWLWVNPNKPLAPAQ